MIDTVLKYFPSLSPIQISRLETLMALYPEWNSKINVISRKDIDNLEINHILHSLSIGKFIKFTPGSDVLDLGCGGGLPGLPLAILFPEVNFHLIDRIAKKVKVASEIAQTAGLVNVSFQHGDSSECKRKFDFVVSRAVMPQNELVKIARPLISKIQRNALPNGVIALKGGDLSAETKTVASSTETVGIAAYFNEPFFETKKIVYTPI